MAIQMVEHIVPERTYEITYLVNSGLTTSELSTVRDEVNTLITKYEGKVSETNDWGKKPLAYIIKDEGKAHKEAIYTHVIAQMSAGKINSFTHELEMKKGIIRYLVVAA